MSQRARKESWGACRWGGHITLDLSDVTDDNVGLEGSFDFGLDVVLSSGWLVRFGGSIGDRDALAIGVKIDT